MKRLIALPAVISLIAVAPPAAQASSPITQETIPVQSAFQSVSVTDPCNGEVITWTGNVHVLGAMTTDANGGAVFLAHINLQDLRGTDPTGTKYTVALADNETYMFAPSSPTLPIPNGYTHVVQFDIISHGSTPNFYEHELGHYIVTPDGQIAVAFDNVGTGCAS